MDKRMKYGCLLTGIIFLLAGCVKDKPRTDPDPVTPVGRNLVYIANEGSLNNGNSSLSVFDTDQDIVLNDVYTKANNQPLGDIFQSMTAAGDYLYLAINNSDKIAVIDRETYKLVTSISVRKPRYMLQVPGNKMYVSSLYYPEVHIIDLGSNQVTSTIKLPYPNTEGMVQLNDKVYVCCWDTACNYLYEIDLHTASVRDSILLAGEAPQQVLADKNNRLWVFAGNAYSGKTSRIMQVDPANRKVIKNMLFSPKAELLKPTWNPGKDTLYYLSVNYDGIPEYNGVFRMPVDAVTPPSKAFIPASLLQYYWGLGVDSLRNQIYIGDPKGFIQKGNVSVYNTSGEKIKSFDVGLGPGYFYFPGQ